MVSSQSLIESLQNNQIPYQEIWGEALGSITHIDTTDGLRLSFAQGEIIHLRPSGNAPELRCYAEADSMSRAEQLVQTTLNYICNTLILR
jgi:phosphomannomutase